VRFLAGLRWGGLRTVEPSAATFVLVLAGGATAAELAVRRTGVRRRAPLATRGAGTLGALAVWAAVWRWDARRWRRRTVRLLPDLPPAGVRDLVERLGDQGYDVEVWEVGGADGPRVGLRCRTSDLRRVNAAIGEVVRAAGPGEG
jgi:hypothetical protein